MDCKISLPRRPKRSATMTTERVKSAPAVPHDSSELSSEPRAITNTSRRNDGLRTRQHKRLLPSINLNTGVNADKSYHASEGSTSPSTLKSPIGNKPHRKLLARKAHQARLSRSLPASPINNADLDPVVAYQLLLAEREKQLSRLLTRMAVEDEIAKTRLKEGKQAGVSVAPFPAED